jgi:hypothetical protein
VFPGHLSTVVCLAGGFNRSWNLVDLFKLTQVDDGENFLDSIRTQSKQR